MKKVRKRRQEEKKKTKSYTKTKYLVWIIIAFGIAAAIYKTHVFSEKKIDLDKLEYVIALPSDKSDLPLLLKEPIMAFKKDFVQDDIEFSRKRYAIVQSKYKNELVANVFIAPMHYQDSNKTLPGLSMSFEIYNMYVSPKYRGKHISISHLYRSLKLLKEIYQIGPNQKSYVILHISPKDKDMDKAYALYRTNGFVHGIFTPYGSYSLRKRSEEFLFPRSVDSVVKEYLRESEGKIPSEKPLDEGNKFLCMFTKLEDFFNSVEINAYTKKDYEYHKKNIESIRKPLLMQYTYN